MAKSLTRVGKIETYCNDWEVKSQDTGDQNAIEEMQCKTKHKTCKGLHTNGQHKNSTIITTKSVNSRKQSTMHFKTQNMLKINRQKWREPTIWSPSQVTSHQRKDSPCKSPYILRTLHTQSTHAGSSSKVNTEVVATPPQASVSYHTCWGNYTLLDNTERQTDRHHTNQGRDESYPWIMGVVSVGSEESFLSELGCSGLRSSFSIFIWPLPSCFSSLRSVSERREREAQLPLITHTREQKHLHSSWLAYYTMALSMWEKLLHDVPLIQWSCIE